MTEIHKDAEHKGRIATFQKLLASVNLQGCLITTNINLFYYSNTMQQGYLFIPTAGEAVFFVRKNYTRARAESSLAEIVEYKRFEDIYAYLNDKNIVLNKIGLELEVLPVVEFQKIMAKLKFKEYQDCSTLIRQQRMLKSALEVELIKESAEKQGVVYQEIPNFLKSAKTDLELGASIEAYARKLGHLGLTRFHGFRQESFFGQILAGTNGIVPTAYDLALGGGGMSPVFPVGLNGQALEKNRPILVDYLGNYTGYNVDLTRVYALESLPEKMKDLYKIALEIQEHIIEKAKVGTTCEELYFAALAIAESYQVNDYFMGFSQKANFIGHGIGLEVNELPVLAPKFKVELQEGMVIAIEPKFTYPEYGAIGIENTFVMHKNGLEKLTNIHEDIVYI